MIFEFRYWSGLWNQNQLIQNIQNGNMMGYKKRVLIVALLGVVLFTLQELWGLNTETISYLYVTKGTEAYLVARIVSLIGAILWALIYIGFHYYFLSFLLSKVTKIEYEKLKIMQLFVVGLLLIEKALLFTIFIVIGATTPYSVFSFGPLASKFLDIEYFIIFFNQLSIFTAFIIFLQYRFIKAFTELPRMQLLGLLVLIQLILAALTATVGVLPIEQWLEQLVKGGSR